MGAVLGLLAAAMDVGLITVALGVVPYIAHRKGRSTIGWFLLGIGFFVVPPLIVLLFLPEKLPSRRCPHCASSIPQVASVCASCGRDVAGGLVPA